MKLDASDIPALEPIIRAVVVATLAELQADDTKLDGRLAYPEAEAAALLGIRPHVLRDARLRGEISGRLAGKKIIYARSELLWFLSNRGPQR